MKNVCIDTKVSNRLNFPLPLSSTQSTVRTNRQSPRRKTELLPLSLRHLDPKQGQTKAQSERSLFVVRFIFATSLEIFAATETNN